MNQDERANAYERIQHRMQHVRGEMLDEKREVAAKTKLLMNWRHHVAAHPITTALVVGALGYCLMPRKPLGKMGRNVEEIREMLRTKANSVAQRPALLSAVAATITSLLVRKVSEKMVSKVSHMFSGSSGDSSQEEASAAWQQRDIRRSPR